MSSDNIMIDENIAVMFENNGKTDYYYNNNNNSNQTDGQSIDNTTAAAEADAAFMDEVIRQLRVRHNRPLTGDELFGNLVIIIGYTIIIFVSLVGNLLVIKVIIGCFFSGSGSCGGGGGGRRKPKMLITTTNLLIVSLAVSDLVMTGFNIPFNVARLLLQSWPFGSFMCVSVPFVQVGGCVCVCVNGNGWVTCVYVSTFTMTAIAYYRWWTLTTRTTPTMSTTAASTSSSSAAVAMATKSLTTWQTLVIVGSIWLLAALFAVPHAAFNRTIVIPRLDNMVRCVVIHPTVVIMVTTTTTTIDWPLWLSIEALATQYFIPLSITGWLYTKIAAIVAKQGAAANNGATGVGQSSASTLSLVVSSRTTAARKRRIVMLALVVIVFGLCWLPLNLYHLLVDFRLIGRNFTAFIVCHWFAMSSVCYNPFIYCYLNQNFKNAAKNCYQFLMCRHRHQHRQQQQQHYNRWLINTDGITSSVTTTAAAAVDDHRMTAAAAAAATDNYELTNVNTIELIELGANNYDVDNDADDDDDNDNDINSGVSD
ncbi:G-protein coupled receptor 83-like [Oppia nitens]|uniref:G-protein coupled receptor 83-like n=1 Tax=Oppia nitens TaxID=1686743 RepID=UPI0023DB4240|nr:G-protein coupled receptor 83-like [Oppia nitens]